MYGKLSDSHRPIPVHNISMRVRRHPIVVSNQLQVIGRANSGSMQLITDSRQPAAEKAYIAAALACLALLAMLVALLMAARITGAEGLPPSGGPTATPTPTIELCSLGYTYTVGTGTIVSSTNLLPGSQCGTCTVPVSFPFPLPFYGHTYTSANISSQGNLQFTTNYTSTDSCSFPISQLGPSILPYWADYIVTDWDYPCEQAYGLPCGVFTSTTGTTPSRIFHIEWRARFGGSNHEVVDFEVRLHEGTGLMDFVYGFGIWYGASIGVQDVGNRYTAYLCDSGISQHTAIHWNFMTFLPCEPTPTPPPINTPTHTPAATYTPTWTSTPTSTPSATPTQCSIVYTYTVSPQVFPPDELLTTSNLLAGSQCENCTVSVPLDIPFTFYGQTYNYANVSSRGTIQFTLPNNASHSCPFPFPQLGPSIMPYWSEFLLVWGGIGPGPCVENYGIPCGIYISTSGSAPNRIFNVQWVGVLYGSNHETVNFGARLYEAGGLINFVYETGVQFGSQGSVGVQDGANRFTSYACNTSANLQNITIHWTPQYSGACPTFTPSLTPTNTPTGTHSPTLTPTPTHTRTPVSTPTWTPTPYPTTTSTPLQPTATDTDTATSTPTPCDLQFVDVPEGSTFYPYIHCLACLGIVNGYDDNTFRPNNNLTRGQLSKIVSNSAGYNEPHTAQTFEDVMPGSTFYEFVERLASRGITSGYQCGATGEPCIGPENRPYFRPGNEMTRGQAAKIIAGAVTLPAPSPSQQTFQDVPPDNTFWQWIEALSGAGAINGYPCGAMGEPCISPDYKPYLRPGNSVTRGQGSKIVANIFFPGCDYQLYSTALSHALASTK